jgi:phosphoglycolate phosphatase-like HAD superfamily hydrolase
MLEGIFFDFDMTLVDSREIGIKPLKDLELNGLSLGSLTEKEIWNSTHENLMKKIAEINNHKLDWREISKLNIKYMQKYYLECKLKSIEFLRELQQKNLKIGVISANSAEMVNLVLNTDYNQQIKFDIVVGQEHLFNNSTKFHLISYVLELFNLNPRNVMYVGDSPSDIAHSNKAGVVSVAVSTGLYGIEELRKYDPNIVIEKLDDLRNFI